MDGLAVEIGRRVRRFRLAQGWSLKETAVRMGNENQYTHWVTIEHGRAAPRIHTLLDIAQALGVLITDLLPPLLTPSALVTWDAVAADGIEEMAAARLIVYLRAIDHVQPPTVPDPGPPPPRKRRRRATPAGAE